MKGNKKKLVLCFGLLPLIGLAMAAKKAKKTGALFCTAPAISVGIAPDKIAGAFLFL